MARKMPVGTIRQWQSGPMIKAHDNSIFNSGWFPLSTSEALERIGRTCDSAANEMIREKIPINGEKFLDHEISEFERPEGEKHGKYTPDDFKQYSGFGGAGYYSFRNEFSRRFMKPKLDAYALIDEQLEEANRIKGEELGKSDDQIQKEIFLSKGEMQDIKTRVRAEIKYDESYFTTEEANELKEIVIRTKKQLDQGLNFEGEEKKAYEGAIKVANSLPEKYDKLQVKKAQMKDAIASIEDTFSDNWGVRESFKTYIEDKYSEYFQKYKDEIFRDEGERQEKLFGVKIDEDPKTFYPKIDRKLTGLTLEQQEEQFPFQELIEMRFEAKYSKQVKGNWNKSLIPALEKIETAINFLPDGHCLTNENLRQITQEDFDGGSHGGYAWYNAGQKRINLSKDAVSEQNVWGRLGEYNEFESTLYHEIGHSVSQKLGRANSLPYKYFVKECGWSYSQAEAQTARGFEATGEDKDVRREGSRQNIPLLTEYAHKSPEEAFAEYYSLYATNKKEVDKWLETGNEKFLHKKEFYGTANPFAGKETVRSTIPDRTSIEPVIKQSIEKKARDSKLDLDDHIKMELINPWHSQVHDYDKHNYSARDKVRRRKGWGFDKVPPVIAVGDSGKFEILDGSNRREQAKMNRKQLPAIVVSKEAYTQLTAAGAHNEDIINYAYSMHKDTRIPKPKEKAEKISGFDYRGSVIPAKKIARSEHIFRRMKAIYDSDELQKAIEVLSLG